MLHTSDAQRSECIDALPAMPAATSHASSSRKLTADDVRASAAELLDDGRRDEALDLFASALGAVLDQVRDQALMIQKLRAERAGRRTEKIHDEQLKLLLEQLGDQEEPAEEKPAELAAESAEDARLDEQIDERRPKRRERQPSVDRKKVERIAHDRELLPEARDCTRCGQPRRRIGSDTTRVLEYVPGHFVEHVYRLAKYACGRCKLGVETPPGPVKPFGCGASPSLLAHVVVSKTHDHTPLTRLHRIFARSGVTIPVSTMADWFAGVADLVAELVDEELAAEVLGGWLVRTDASGLKVLDPDDPEHIQRGTMWCYVGEERNVLFRYAETGKGEHGPWTFLAGREGYVQADASNVFDRLFNGEVAQAIEVGCWSHARRGLFKLKDTDCRVAYPLMMIRRLFRLEELFDLDELAPDARLEQRHERSAPTLDKLKRWLVGVQQHEPPASALAQASAYILNHWVALTRFMADGRLGLDNNLCERQIRDLALGRKNFLFAGSHDAARRLARLYSLMRTCAQHDVEPLAYLTDVIEKLAAGWPRERLAELLPGRWAERHAPA